VAAQQWLPENALVEIIRGRLEGLSPVTERALAESLPVAASSVASALVALQTEGFALCGYPT